MCYATRSRGNAHATIAHRIGIVADIASNTHRDESNGFILNVQKQCYLGFEVHLIIITANNDFQNRYYNVD